MEKYFSPSIRTSSDISLDIFEPIALQLPELIEQLRLEGQAAGTCTSDSGALSDYESSVCETDELRSESNASLVTLRAEETHKSPPDPWPDMRREGEASDKSPSDGRLSVDGSNTTITPSPTELSRSASESNIESVTVVPSTTEMDEFFTRVKEASNESEEDSPPPNTGQSQEDVQTEVILVTDLEKEFFSDSSEDFSPEKSEHRQEYFEDSRMEDTRSKYLDNRSNSGSTSRCVRGGYRQRRFGGSSKRGRGRWQRGEESQQQRTSTYQGDRQQHHHHNRRGRCYSSSSSSTTSSSSSGYRGRGSRGGGFRPHYGRDRYRGRENDGTVTDHHNTSRWPSRQSAEDCDQRPLAARKQQENVPKSIYRDKKLSESNDKPAMGVSERKESCGSHQPSPLVIHSQNMWSAKIDTIKSSTARRNTYVHHRHHRDQRGNSFNHYEVGCFLMEGTYCMFPIVLHVSHSCMCILAP